MQKNRLSLLFLIGTCMLVVFSAFVFSNEPLTEEEIKDRKNLGDVSVERIKATDPKILQKVGWTQASSFWAKQEKPIEATPSTLTMLGMPNIDIESLSKINGLKIRQGYFEVPPTHAGGSPTILEFAISEDSLRSRVTAATYKGKTVLVVGREDKGLPMYIAQGTVSVNEDGIIKMAPGNSEFAEVVDKGVTVQADGSVLFIDNPKIDCPAGETCLSIDKNTVAIVEKEYLVLLAKGKIGGIPIEKFDIVYETSKGSFVYKSKTFEWISLANKPPKMRGLDLRFDASVVRENHKTALKVSKEGGASVSYQPAGGKARDVGRMSNDAKNFNEQSVLDYGN